MKREDNRKQFKRKEEKKIIVGRVQWAWFLYKSICVRANDMRKMVSARKPVRSEPDMPTRDQANCEKRLSKLSLLTANGKQLCTGKSTGHKITGSVLIVE